jgi:hypothetical protein
MMLAINGGGPFPIFLAEPSAMMSGSQFVGILVMIFVVITGNLVGPVSLALSYTKIRDRWIVPLTGLVAVACGVALMAYIRAPATSAIRLVAWLPLVMGGFALFRWCYRRYVFHVAKKAREQGAP